MLYHLKQAHDILNGDSSLVYIPTNSVRTILSLGVYCKHDNDANLTLYTH